MSINSREDANKYYQQINSLVDDYIDKWKIKPSNLKNYLKPGSRAHQRFLMKNNLSDVKGANTILNDVLDDRASIESDGVQTFESFKYFESSEFKIDSLKQCLYKGVDKSDINYEKSIADFFDTNLGAIDVLDSDKHKFSLQDWNNDDWNVVVYSEDDIEIIKFNIIEHLYEEITKNEVELVDDIKLNLYELVAKENFEKKLSEILSLNKLKKIIAQSLGEDWLYEGNINKFYFWVS